MKLDPLRQTRLGRTDLSVTALGLGGAGLAESTTDDEAAAVVAHAMASGVNYIDTSPLYGESERRVGLALVGGLREKIVLSTKTGTHPSRRGDYSRDATLWSIENSLKTLRTNWIDLALVHDPDSMEPVLNPGGALDALEELKSQRVIRAIGLGQRFHAFHRMAIETGRIDAILTYSDYTPIRTTAADWLLPLAFQHDIGVINGSPMDHGLLTGEDPDDLIRAGHRFASNQDALPAARLYHFCREHHISMAALVLQFPLRQSLLHTTLTGAKSIAELTANLNAIQSDLPDSIWSELNLYMNLRA